MDKAAGSVLVAALLLAAGSAPGEPPPQAPLQSSQDGWRRRGTRNRHGSPRAVC